jgi:flagellar hook-associated protein 2
MGTISSALSSTSNTTNTPVTSSSAASSGSSSTNSSGIFTGTSAYSQDFQNVIERAVAIASLPINLLTNQQTALNNQATELTTLDTDFTAVQSSIQAIADAMGGSGMNATVSDPSVASVTAGDGAVQGAYSINVSSIGAYATSLSSTAWNAASDPSGQATAYNLVVGGNTYSFTPSDNSAATVASAINAQYGNLVQATAVNVGSAANPDYRISLQSATLGPGDLDIQAPAQTNLQTAEAATTGYALSQTASTWDSSGSPSTYTLVVDGSNYTIAPADNSAASVAAAINALSGNPVQATVVNLGASDSPDERIQLQSTSAGVSTVDLEDSSGDSLQEQETPVAAGSAVSQTSWTWDPTPDPSGNPTEYTLTAAGAPQTFTVDDNSAEGVAAAINALSGNPVTATVVDLGTASQPDYRIQLVDNTGSSASPQLSRDTPFDLQTQGQPPGSLAQYEVANSGVPVSSDSRSVSIAAGTTLTLTGTGSTDVVVTQSASTLNTALSGFADAYNAAIAELAKQRGQSGGPLQGESIVNNLSQALSAMSTYFSSSAGSIGMADLGFSLNDDGTLTYSPFTMMSTDLVNSAGVTAFLGSATGGGFLEAATNAINSIEDSNTGLLKTTEAAVQSQITSIGNTITDKQNAVDQLQTNLTNQMAQADAAIATMEQQYSYLNSMFAAEQTADEMYANGG